MTSVTHMCTRKHGHVLAFMHTQEHIYTQSIEKVISECQRIPSATPHKLLSSSPTDPIPELPLSLALTSWGPDANPNPTYFIFTREVVTVLRRAKLSRAHPVGPCSPSTHASQRSWHNAAWRLPSSRPRLHPPTQTPQWGHVCSHSPLYQSFLLLWLPGWSS